MLMSSASKCVLFFNDDGACVYNVRSSGVEHVDNVLWDDQDFENSLSDLIRNRCGAKPVIIINDMVEQHYRKEKIPKASYLDRVNIIKRRLSGAFPSYPIRASLKLKEKSSALDPEKSGDIYLFAAVPMTEGLRKAISAIQKAGSSISSFCLLPVEATSVAHDLGKKISKVNLGNADWTILVSQHQSGGLRQVVTKNGELALTRITPISSPERGVDAWCSDVATELRGTMGYLTRFGFSAADGLNIIIVSSLDIESNLTSKIDFECDLNFLTMREAAEALGLKMGRSHGQENFADPLYVVAIAKKRSFAMPLVMGQFETINRPIQIVNAAYIALFVLICFFGYLAISKTIEIVNYSSEIEIAKTDLETAKQERVVEAEKKKQTGVDYLLLKDSTDLFTKLDSESMRPLGVFDSIGKSLGPNLYIKNIEIKESVPDILNPTNKASGAGSKNAAQQPANKPKEFDVALSLIFPKELEPEIPEKNVMDFVNRLKAALPNHKVELVKKVEDLSYTGNFVSGDAENLKAQEEDKDYESQILIKGALQ